tara:strand:- start:240 stop:1475 length:1236 start_codon:yes stop_codon:yes gene_type:complete
MHISLDSALGRDIRLNRIGETINSIAVPAAGYSLRSLSGGDPLAVRVRREVTAASPLESEKDFTVSEVASGALVDFVNSTVFTRTDELILGAGAGFVGLGENIKCIIGTRYKVTFELKQNSGGSGTVSGNPRFRTSSTFAYSNVVKSSNITESTNRFEVNAATTAYQSYSIEFTVDSGTAAGKNFTFQNSDSDDGYTARNINIEVVAGNGFISIWYDQSGNNNNLTQTDTAKQPKIVDSGSLVTISSKPALEFDGTDDLLEKETFTQGTLSQPNTFFAVAKLDSNDDTNRKIFDSHNSTGRNMLFLSPTNAGEFGFFATAVITTGETADANNNLFTALYDGTSSVLRVNTVQKAAGNVGTMSMIGLIIGESHNQNSNVWKGNIQEIIVYNSDQTSKFTALETNIKNNYSIS